VEVRQRTDDIERERGAAGDAPGADPDSRLNGAVMKVARTRRGGRQLRLPQGVAIRTARSAFELTRCGQIGDPPVESAHSDVFVRILPDIAARAAPPGASVQVVPKLSNHSFFAPESVRRWVFARYVPLVVALFTASSARAVDPAPAQGEADAPEAEPRDAERPASSSRARFAAHPVTDGAIISVSLGFGALSELVITTGEIIPQQPQPSTRLLEIDRLALFKHESSARPTSNIGALVALLYAVVDPIVTGYRDGPSSGLVDAVIYAEALALTWAATNMSKLTVRRPRPAAYQEQERLYEEYGMENAPSITGTDTALSFFSGHTALAASVTSTATYLAFVRSPDSPRPWITLIAGTALTGFVAVQRVRAGAHFPTDVIAAAMAGTGIGLLVAHLHREETSLGPPLWIGFDRQPGGGTLSLGGLL
jgi:hypothetical protein